MNLIRSLAALWWVVVGLCLTILFVIPTLILGVAVGDERGATEFSFDQWLLRAYSDDIEAQFYVGVTLAEGIEVSQDLPESVHWYRRAAENGYAPAQYNLADSYLRGLGINQDARQAVYWWRKAAEQGYVLAQSNLGRAYYLGVGVPRNFERARFWLSQAREQGDGKAAAILAELNKYSSASAAATMGSAPNGLPLWVFGEFVQGNGDVANIVGTGVRARSVPGTGPDSIVLGVFSSNQQVAVLRRKAGWVQVSTVVQVVPQPDSEGEHGIDLVGLPNSLKPAPGESPARARSPVEGGESTEDELSIAAIEFAEQAEQVKQNNSSSVNLVQSAQNNSQTVTETVRKPDLDPEPGPKSVDLSENEESPAAADTLIIPEQDLGQNERSSEAAEQTGGEGQTPADVNMAGQSDYIEPSGGRETVAETLASMAEPIAAPEQPVGEKIQVMDVGRTPRLANDNDWLFAQPPDHYTIQLSSVNTEAEAIAYIKRHKLNDTGYFATRKGQTDWYYMLTGTYPSMAAATRAAKKLPVRSVWVRNLGKLQISRCEKSTKLPESFTGELKSHCA